MASRLSCCPAGVDVLGEASSPRITFRYLRCVDCERVWRQDRWNIPPNAAWTQALARRLAELDAEARAACYS